MYIFKKKSLKILFFIVDCIGFLLSAPFKMLKKSVSGEPHKVLVIRLDHIGDVVFATPALRALRQKFANAKITVLVGSWARDIISNNPCVDEILVYDAPWFRRSRSGNSGGFWQLVKRLQKENFDAAIDLRGDARNILLLWLGGVKRRIGYGITGGGFLLTDKAAYKKERHEIEHNLGLVRAIGAAAGAVKPEIFLSGEDCRKVADYLKREGVGGSDALIGIHPAAGAQSKLWQPRKFAALIDKLQEEFGAKAVVVGNDSAVCSQTLFLMKGKCINAVGKTSLGELAALIKRCNLFISADSGPAHIAAALGVPLVVLWSGTNDPEQWAPVGEKVLLVRKDVSCSPCGKKICRRPICMESISVDDAMNAAKQLLIQEAPCASA